MNFVFEKTRKILLSKNLWTKKYDDRVVFEYVHIFRILNSSGYQYLKKFFNLLTLNEFPLLALSYLNIKKYQRKQHIKNLFMNNRILGKQFYSIGIKSSLKIILTGIINLFMSLLNKLLEIIGIVKKF
ncbi:MAG: hypothetical protein ACRCTQ_06435 [Brevinemataceae bacterium]